MNEPLKNNPELDEGEEEKSLPLEPEVLGDDLDIDVPVEDDRPCPFCADRMRWRRSTR